MPIVGTAGWSVDRKVERFAQTGSMLERYASVFDGVEVNSSFYRRHRPETWVRWHDAVPDDFRFAVKMAKTVTHERGLVDVEGEVGLFFADVAALKQKLGPVLVQLPPKLVFDEAVAATFFRCLRRYWPGKVEIEPRHVSWSEGSALTLLRDFKIGFVLADPQGEELRQAAVAMQASYIRLHGSPKIYYSSYTAEDLQGYAALLGPETWCIFDNTASGAAQVNGIEMLDLLGRQRSVSG